MTTAAEVEAPSEDDGSIRPAIPRVDPVPASKTDAVLIPLVLVALCLLVRTLWLEPVEIWGDAGQKWHFARQWAYDNDFSHAWWGHQMARLGINVLAFLVQRLFGTGAITYYILPVTAFTVQVVFVYLIARRLAGQTVGVLTALLVIFFPGMIRSASQLLPDGIAGTMLVVAVYLWLCFHEAEGRARLYWLLGVSGAVVWAYAMKESNAFFFPAFAVSVWLSRRSFKEAAILTGVVLGYGLLETAGFALFTQYGSRYAIVDGAPEYTPITFWQLFTRYRRLEPSWQGLLWAWLPSALWLAGGERRLKPIVIIPATFLFLLTFLVRHIHPLAPWIGNKSRYLAVIMPFLALGIGLCVADLAQRLWRAHQRPFLERALASLGRDVLLFTFALCGFLGLVAYRRAGSDRFWVLRTLATQASVLNDAYRRNLPILDFSRDRRALKTIYAVHLSDKYLAQADNAQPGWLPDINDAVRTTKLKARSGSYLLVNARAYRLGDMDKQISRDCAIIVYEDHGFVGGVPLTKLPPSCKARGFKPLQP